MRSKNEIDQQVQSLKFIKKSLPEFTIHGESYAGAIDAMVEVLSTDMNGDDIPERYLKLEIHAPDFTMNCAFSARDWLDGNYEGNLVNEFSDVMKRLH